jgi:hypothetical protein
MGIDIVYLEALVYCYEIMKTFIQNSENKLWNM